MDSPELNLNSGTLQSSYLDLAKTLFSRCDYTPSVKRESLKPASQKLLKELLQASEKRFRNMIANNADGILILDHAGKVQYANLAAAALFRRRSSELQGYSLFDELVLENSNYDLQTDVIYGTEEVAQDNLRVVQTQVEILHPDGQITIAEVRMVDTEWEGQWACLATLRDVTEKHRAKQALQRSEAELRQKAQDLEVALEDLKQAQAKLVHSEKMFGVAQMVAGIAHEINNPLNFIQGNLPHIHRYVQGLLEVLKLYQTYFPASVPAIDEALDELDLEFVERDSKKILDSVFSGSDRIRQIVKSLRSFSHLDEAEIKSVDIHEGIESTLLILESRLKAQANRPAIEVIRQYGQLPKVVCYSRDLNQVFFNLLINAIDALEEQVEHLHARPDSNSNSSTLGEAFPLTITIRTESRDGRIYICIRDNGIGILEEAQKHIFNPFFTTKPVGQGQGLGLAISHQVIQKHHGTIQCYSEPGVRTEFQIEIPNALPGHAS